MTAVADGKVSRPRLVIFGCGYVGAAVAAQARARNVDVTALTRNPDTAILLREQGIETVVADLADDGWHDAIAGAPELALNCVSSGGAGIEGYRHSYVQGMASVLRWARARGGPGTLVYTSSTSVYPQDGGAEVDETAPTTGHAAGGRSALLVEAESLLRTGAGSEAAGRWFILRIAGIYGPGRHHLLEQVRSGEIAGVGAHRLNLAHRDDIAAAIWACFEAPPAIANEIFNVADDEPTPKREVVAWLAARLGAPPPRFTGGPAALTRSGQPVGRRGITPDRVIANGKLKRVLGWAPRYPSFRVGFENLLSR